MKSVRTDGNGKISIVEVDAPTPGEGEVVIRTAASAICGSELHLWREKGMPEGNLGHEAVGTVLAVGPSVTTPAIGQRVGVCTVSGCGKCDYCAKGQYTWCEQRSYYGSMHAEQFLASAHACYVLPDDISWEAGVLLTGDGFGVPYHSNTRIDPSETETVAILGMGPIGLGHTLMQHFLGRQVIAVDIVPYRLELAQRLGATHVVDAGKGSVEEDVPDGTVDACRVLSGFEPPNDTWPREWTYVMIEDTDRGMQSLWKETGFIDMIPAKFEDFTMLSDPAGSKLCFFIDAEAFNHPVNRSREYLKDARRRGDQSVSEFEIPIPLAGETDGLVPVILAGGEKLYVARPDFGPCAHAWSNLHPDNSEWAVVNENSAVPLELVTAKPPVKGEYADRLLPPRGSADMTTDWFSRGLGVHRQPILHGMIQG